MSVWLAENNILAVALIGLLITVVALAMSKKPVTVRNIIDAGQQAAPHAVELAQVATIAAQAAEQLKLTGKLSSNQEALDYAINYVKKWSPLTSGMENEKIIAAIESAVLVANSLSKHLITKEGPDVQPTTPDPTTPTPHP